MKDIHTVAFLVEDVLKKNAQARNSDNELYGWVCLKSNPEIKRYDFLYVLAHQKELGIPKFETVRRCRQKIQADNPSLRATDKVTDGRYENWKAVRGYVNK